MTESLKDNLFDSTMWIKLLKIEKDLEQKSVHLDTKT